MSDLVEKYVRNGAWLDAQDFSSKSTYTPWGWDSPVHRTLYPGHYIEHDTDGEGKHIRWADHQDVDHPSAGRTRYICHPYQLHGEALDDFAKLRAHGWRVDVFGSSEYHEHALKVIIENRVRWSKCE